MGTVKVVEVFDQGGDTRRHLERLEHVIAHEVGQIADRLHGHSLVKQLQGLFVVYSEAAPEPGAVGWKAVEHLDATAAQAFAQWCYLAAETGEIPADGQIPFRADKKPRRL